MNRQVFPPNALFPLRGDLSAENGATKVEVIGLQNILMEPNPLIDNFCPLYKTYTGDIVWGQQLTLFANEYLVSSQEQIDFHAGTGISIVDNGSGMLTLSAPQQLSLFANEYLVSSQTQVDFHAGPGISIVDDGLGMLTISTNILGPYANNAAALLGGLVAGDLYAVTGTDPRQVAVVF
jgi:hypothetical protein